MTILTHSGLLEQLVSKSSFIGSSDAAIKLKDSIALCAASDAPILIQGETGSGKEIVCRELHRLSGRSDQNFVGINCAAIPAQLLESELFGHKKGAFSGALADRVGRFQLANKGTLFLDEIGDMPLELQAKILRVLEEREVHPLGSSTGVEIDVRLISATHQDLEAMVARREFREDLYYRLNVIPIFVPPLRERQGDIAKLCQHYLSLYSQNRQMRFTSKSADLLQRYRWPGNVRELANLVRRLSVLSLQEEIDLSQVPPAYLPPQLEELLQSSGGRNQVTGELKLPPSMMAQLQSDEAEESDKSMSAVERIVGLSQSMVSLPKEGVAAKDLLGGIESNLIRVALKQSGGNVSKAAKLLNVGRTTLIQKLDRYQIEVPT